MDEKEYERIKEELNKMGEDIKGPARAGLVFTDAICDAMEKAFKAGVTPFYMYSFLTDVTNDLRRMAGPKETDNG
jgi:hypothetical protein